LQRCEEERGGGGGNGSDVNNGQLRRDEFLGFFCSDPNFEIWSPKEPNTGESFENGLSFFFGFRETDDMRLHGVYAKNLNKELISAVNALRVPLLTLPVTPPDCRCPLVMVSLTDGGGDVVQGGMTNSERWVVLRDTAYKILESKCISRCKCGF